MIKTDIVTINGAEYKHSFSDIGLMLERDGEIYDDAIDPKDSERVYKEIEPVNKEITEEDYIRILKSLGVDV